MLFERPLRLPDPRPATAGAGVETLTSVAIEAPEVCSRFTARVISGATVRESPWWLRKRLETLGVRPISNIVDVTNYVMFEIGQPLHAYDLDRLAGRRLVVRRARPGETLKAINGKVYELSGEMLVIADAERPVGLAGVMGGLETEIGTATKNVLIEAAQFDAMSVRKTSRALGLFSPSSHRFERPIDPEATDWASRRCAELILETAGGTLHPGVIDLGPKRPAREPLTLRLDQIPRVLGIEIDRATVERILKALGLEPKGSTDSHSTLTFVPPTWRSDLEREIDLIEEVARIHGYEHIPEDRAVPLTSAPRGPRERVEGAIREAMTGFGFDEAVTYSLVAHNLSPRVGPVVVPIQLPLTDHPLKVDHSSRQRDGFLRRSLVPSLLAARSHNEAHGILDADLFEIADVYLPRSDQGIPDQPAKLGMVSGRSVREFKGIIETLLARLHVSGPVEIRAQNTNMFRDGRSGEILIGGTSLGYFGEVREGWQVTARDAVTFDKKLELRGVCHAAELDLSILIKTAVLIPQNKALPPFPSVERDLSLVVARSLPWAELADAVTGAAGSTLEDVQFLDTFHGGNVPEGQHSVHFALRFRHPERTLTGEEVDRSVRAVIEACSARFEAALRA